MFNMDAGPGTTMYSYITSTWSPVGWEVVLGAPIQISTTIRIICQRVIIADYERDKEKKNSAQKVIHVSDMYRIAAIRTTSNTVKVD